MKINHSGSSFTRYIKSKEALKDISSENINKASEYVAHRNAYHVPEAGKLHDVPREKIFIPLENAAGKICAGSIIPYPPGIPFVCPGEEITADIIRYIKAMRADGEKVIGVNDKGEVLVGK